MRSQLAKSLQTRCKAIQRAVATYNTAATALNPPRAPLDWSQVSNYGFIEEFALLRNTRNDIRAKDWVKPLYREMLKMRQRLARAKEEVTRCNVEVRRVYTAICDETKLFSQVLKRLEASKDPIYGSVCEYVAHRKVANRAILQRVEQIHSLHGFTGNRMRGVREGSDDVMPEDSNADEVSGTPVAEGGDDDDGNGTGNNGDDGNESDIDPDDIENDEEVHTAVDRMENFYANID